MVIRLLFLSCLVIWSVPVTAHAAEEGCIECHGSAEKMRQSGSPRLFFSADEIREKTRMSAACSDCHLGDPTAVDRESGHRGLLTVRAVTPQWKAIVRKDMEPADLVNWEVIRPRGSSRVSQLLPKDPDQKDLRAYSLIIWHDKNDRTLAFNPGIAAKTCGKCHAEILKGFLKSPMGGAKEVHAHSQYKSWTGPAGPQSCGLWTGTLSMPDQDGFTSEHRDYYNSHSTAQLSQKAADNSQRNCNRCHVGCLDCHLEPSGKDNVAAHTFIRKPTPLSCYGGGRSFICHAGPLERRRGDGYLRAEFTQAAFDGKALLNREPDAHMLKGISCVDCHQPNTKTGFHADLTRHAKCSRCHETAVKDHRRGPHRNVDCASCHTKLIGGYAFNFWTATGSGDDLNPVTRIQDYQVEAMTPLIIRNPRGTWIPVHPVPHTSGNVRADEVRLSKRLLFRNRPDVKINRRYFSNDSFAVTGLIRDTEGMDRGTMVWINLDRVAHATGRSRDCSSCHASTGQKIRVRFDGGSYRDVEDGEYTITADSRGLRITDFKGPDNGPAAKALAPFSDKWQLRGDFSLPPVRNKALYRRLEAGYDKGSFRH